MLKKRRLNKLELEMAQSALSELIKTGKEGSTDALQLYMALKSTGSTWIEIGNNNPQSNDIVTFGKYMSHFKIGGAEISAAQIVKGLNKKAFKIDESSFRYAMKENSRISEEQAIAAYNSLSSGISAISGGPGTGKTTTLKLIVDYLVKANKTFCLMSPTAIGAERIKNSTGMPSSTIHLKLQYSKGNFSNDKISEQFIIVDESSMMDSIVFNALLSRMNSEAQILLMGDKNQLPSVGFGNVFRDICACVKTSTLTKIFRTDSDGPVGQACRSILDGERISEIEHGESFVKVIECETERINKEIIAMVQYICSQHGERPEEIKITAPTNERCSYINIAMANKFSEAIPFRNTINDYKRGLFNGSIGISKDGGKTARFPESGIVDLDSRFKMSFCSTIHSLQGTESNTIIVAVPRKDILKKSAIYTAVSRARLRAILIGDSDSVLHASRQESESERTSLLKELVKGQIEWT